MWVQLIIGLLDTLVPILAIGGAGYVVYSSVKRGLDAAANKRETKYLLKNYDDVNAKAATLIYYYISNCKRDELVDFLKQIQPAQFNQIAQYYMKMYDFEYSADCWGPFNDVKLPAGGNLLAHLQIFLGDRFMEVSNHVL